MREKLEQLCIKYKLGRIVGEPETVGGGLLHHMFHVHTTQGEYAIKVLNPDIMKRPKALSNMIHSEIVSNLLKDRVSLIAAKCIEGKHVIEEDDAFYMIYDWLEGGSVFAPDITVYDCEQIGSILGKIHVSDINIDSMEKQENSRDLYDWKLYLQKAEQENAECYEILKEHLESIVDWDKAVIAGFEELSAMQVISHRDLDPKNVMWKDKQPYIIDWEAAGYVNPYQELIEVLNYWITEEDGNYSKEKFDALLGAYTESMNISNVNWDTVLQCSFDGMLGWLEYNVKRALGLEGSGSDEQKEGLEQMKGTICELKKYDSQAAQLKDWIMEYVGRKYSI